jgi:L-serine deaminase
VWARVLGNYQVNIAGMHVGRESMGGRAVMILQVDNPIPPEAFAQIRQLEGVDSARVVGFRRGGTRGAGRSPRYRLRTALERHIGFAK